METISTTSVFSEPMLFRKYQSVKKIWYSPVLCSWSTNIPHPLIFSFFLILAPVGASNPVGP